jgi:catechol 2,3-dioxygenase-like lactoylglutathione lyase family enzyme
VTPQPLVGIDHVIVAVRDLDRARLAWTRLGFTLTPRGRHLQKGTGNYCIMFERDYIELMGVVAPEQGTGGLDAFLARGEGPSGLAFATRAGDATAAELQRRGLHPAPPSDLTRQLELPEGTVLPRFKLVRLPPEETPALSAFVCQHLTPELVRRPQWLAHANAITGITGVTVMVEATEPLRGAYDRLFGAGVNTTDDVLTVHVGRHRILFATPDDVSALYPQAEIDLDRPLPAIVALTLRSADIARTTDHLTQWQVAYEELAAGNLLVPPEEANGALLVVVGR